LNEALVSPAFSGPCILFRISETSSNTDFRLMRQLFNFTRLFDLALAFHGTLGFVRRGQAASFTAKGGSRE
jgi:hypothetical protein